MSTAAQQAANLANAQHSTGPKTEEGKAISSRNNFRHGCTGKFMLLPQESAREFHELTTALNEEHQPTTPTETLLVERMVQHFWLSQRAMRLQNFCFDDGLQQPDLQKLGLYLRYQSTHDRAFHKCLTELQKLRAEKRKEEMHEARVRALNAKSEDQELDTEIRTTLQAPLPGNVRIPFHTVQHVLSASLKQVAEELQQHAQAEDFTAAA
jgi:hypothetical protein